MAIRFIGELLISWTLGFEMVTGLFVEVKGRGPFGCLEETSEVDEWLGKPHVQPFVEHIRNVIQ